MPGPVNDPRAGVRTEGSSSPAWSRLTTARGSSIGEGMIDMAIRRWPIVIPVAAFFLGSVAWGSAIKDDAKMFSPQVVEEAQRRLDRLERATSVPVVIETIEHLQGLGNEAPNSERREAINKV